jgi:hypothetical protein
MNTCMLLETCTHAALSTIFKSSFGAGTAVLGGAVLPPVDDCFCFFVRLPGACTTDTSGGSKNMSWWKQQQSKLGQNSQPSCVTDAPDLLAALSSPGRQSPQQILQALSPGITGMLCVCVDSEVAMRRWRLAPSTRCISYHRVQNSQSHRHGCCEACGVDSSK